MQNHIASKGKGILAMDESNATCGLRLASIGLENTEANRQAYRTLLVSTPGIGEYVSGAILFEETLYQNTTSGEKMVDVLNNGGLVPGIKVDKVRAVSCRPLDFLVDLRISTHYFYSFWITGSCSPCWLQQRVLVPGSRRPCLPHCRLLQAGCPLRQVALRCEHP